MKKLSEKKMITGAVLLSLILPFTLVGCSSGKPSQPTAQQTQPASSAPTAQSPTPPKGDSTVASAALDQGAFKYEMSIVQAPQTGKVNEPINVTIKVKNAGDKTWPALGQPDTKFLVNLGYHIMDGDNLVTEGRLGNLPHDIKPGEEFEVIGTVPPFKKQGKETLQFDLVQENVQWFSNVKDSHNQPLNYTVDVK